MKDLIRRTGDAVSKVNDGLGSLLSGSLIIVAFLVSAVVSLPFLPFILISSHFSNKEFQKKYNLYLERMNGACYFCYNSRKSSVQFAREVIIPQLSPTICIVFVNGKLIDGISEKDFISRMLYDVKSKGQGFPYLMKISNGQVLDCSVHSQFYKILQSRKSADQLLERINSFYQASAA